MNKRVIDKKKLLGILVVALFLTYGIHYFGYFIRVRYFNLIAPIAEANPGLHSILRYLGHLIFWGVFIIYAFQAVYHWFYPTKTLLEAVEQDEQAKREEEQRKLEEAKTKEENKPQENEDNKQA